MEDRERERQRENEKLFGREHSWSSLIAQLVKKSACNAGDQGSTPVQELRGPVSVYLT